MVLGGQPTPSPLPQDDVNPLPFPQGLLKLNATGLDEKKNLRILFKPLHPLPLLKEIPGYPADNK